MVPGLSVFRNWFENYHGRHVIIGGTACNLVYAQYGAPERATKDIDLVVLAEAFDRAYFDRFVTFVHAGGYEHRTKDGRYQLFRFERPSNADFPPKIELLSRRPEVLDGVETALGRFRITDGDYSLSAILLDDDYYRLLEHGVETIDGLPVLGLRYLPVFKMHAWANLTRNRANGLAVHSDEINKHRSDVCKLCSLFNPGETVELPEPVREEVAGFVDAHPWNDNMLRGWHLPVDSEGMAGGAMVLGGLVAGPALMVMGLVAGGAADKELEKARTNSAEAQTVVAQVYAASAQCDAIRRRTSMFYNLLARLV